MRFRKSGRLIESNVPPLVNILATVTQGLHNLSYLAN